MLTGPEKAVLFLLTLDEDVAGPIVRDLKEPELRKLREVASTMREIKSDALDEVFRDFLDQSSSAVAVPRGGLGYLRRLTAGVLGEDRAREVFEDGHHSPLDRIEAARPEVVATLLTREPPQLVAAILARIQPANAAAILGHMDPERQAAVITRVGKMTQIPAGTLEDVASALVGELPAPEAETLVGVDGLAKAAQILNASGQTVAGDVLRELEVAEPDLARQVQLAMFTFEELVRLDAKAMQTLLREVATERLTVALKGASDGLRDAVFAGLSARQAELIKDDLELLGKVRKTEVEKARTEIVETALRLEMAGLLDLGRGGD
jgi:flagellar motor switch protein FliG